MSDSGESRTSVFNSIADTVYGILKYLYTVDAVKSWHRQREERQWISQCLPIAQRDVIFQISRLWRHQPFAKSLPTSIVSLKNKERTQYGEDQKQSSRTCWWRWSWPCWQALCPLWAPGGIAEDDPEESVFAFLLHCGVHSWVPIVMSSSEDNDGWGGM